MVTGEAETSVQEEVGLRDLFTLTFVQYTTWCGAQLRVGDVSLLDIFCVKRLVIVE